MTKEWGSMLAIAISLLFGFAAFASLAAVHASLVTGVRRARCILGELAEMDRAGRAARVDAKPAPIRAAEWVFPPRCAAA